MRQILKSLAGWWLNRRLPGDLDRGDICAVMSGEGSYKIVKVLHCDSATVHIRLYKDRFPTPPVHVITATLSMGTINDSDGFGIGHLPISRSTFAAWLPERIGREPVTDDEMEGYRVWKESEGGVFS